MKEREANIVKISAIICTHNRSDVLPKAIESLIDQSVPIELYEILAIDNASTDDTKEICTNYLAIPNFKYIFEKTPGLSQARNRGLSEAQGKYVAFIDDDAIASKEWLEIILRAFETVTPPPASVGGKIDPIWEIPKPEWLPEHKKPYLTILDYGNEPAFLTYPQILYGTNMAFTKESLVSIGGFRTDVGRMKQCLLSGEEMEVYRRLTEIKLPTYYVPTASVRHLVPAKRLNKRWLYSRHYWQGRSEILVLPDNISRQSLNLRFSSSIHDSLAAFLLLLFSGRESIRFTHTASFLQQLGRMQQLFLKLRQYKPSSGKPSLLVIARTLPRHDRGSGHLRFFHILEILSTHFKISYLAESYSNSSDCNDEPYASSLRHLGIDVHTGSEKLTELLANDYGTVLFEFYDTATRHLKYVKARLPHSLTVVDSVDVHFAREIQMANVHENREMLNSALETKRKELEIYKKCDLTWAVTGEDRDILHKEVKNLKVDIIPNIHKSIHIQRDFIEKNSLLFIGNFWHQPNEDAVVYFCQEILPLIQSEVKDLVFYVVGNAPTEKIKALENDTVKVIGWVPETKPYLEKCHVSVVPLRYGAGMKGKVGEAMSAGIPVVTTPVGVQGMDVSNGIDILVSDSAESFANNVKLLLNDPSLFARISSNSKMYIHQRFDYDLVANSVVTSIKKAIPPQKGAASSFEILALAFKSLAWKRVPHAEPTYHPAMSDEFEPYSDSAAQMSMSGIGDMVLETIDVQDQDEKIVCKLVGTSAPGLWSLGCTQKFKLSAGERYIFTGSMLIESGDFDSFFKCELFNGDQWIRNFDSSHYTPTCSGKWQKLTVSFDTPVNSEPLIRIAVEKRPHDKEISTSILVGHFHLSVARLL